MSLGFVIIKQMDDTTEYLQESNATYGWTSDFRDRNVKIFNSKEEAVKFVVDQEWTNKRYIDVKEIRLV